MKRIVWAGRAALVSIVLAVGAPALAADATLNQVYEAVHAGHLNQAQAMMTEVLRDHPNSAKAHYVEAEILARQGRTSEAQGELNRAEQLAPGLPFVSSTSVQELRGLMASSGSRQAPIVTPQPIIAPATHESPFPWGLVLIVLIGGVIVYAIVRARRNAVAAPYSGGASASSYGAPPMAPPMAPMGGGGIGSGIVGGLVTGAAVGAGVVAGEALAHEVMDGHASRPDLHRGDAPAPLADNDLGGQDFGISDSGSWDDGGGSLGGGGDWN
jgi:uncharacterized protein